MDKKKTRMSREERREQILASALKSFTSKGYNTTTTKTLAEDAGISEVTLFRYFDSKDEIFKSAIEPWLLKELQKTRDSIEEMEINISFHDRLKYVLQERIEFVTNNHEVVKLVFIEHQLNPNIANVNFITEIKRTLEESILDPNLEIPNQDFFMRLLIGFVLSYLYEPILDEELIQEHVEKFVESLAKTNIISQKGELYE